MRAGIPRSYHTSKGTSRGLSLPLRVSPRVASIATSCTNITTHRHNTNIHDPPLYARPHAGREVAVGEPRQRHDLVASPRARLWLRFLLRGQYYLGPGEGAAAFLTPWSHRDRAAVHQPLEPHRLVLPQQRRRLEGVPPGRARRVQRDVEHRSHSLLVRGRRREERGSPVVRHDVT